MEKFLSRVQMQHADERRMAHVTRSGCAMEKDKAAHGTIAPQTSLTAQPQSAPPPPPHTFTHTHTSPHLAGWQDERRLHPSGPKIGHMGGGAGKI